VLQIVLGIYTVLTMRYVPVAVGHFAGAVSLWALWMSALLMTRRLQVEVAIAPGRDVALMEVPG
jgi:heme A synthase